MNACSGSAECDSDDASTDDQSLSTSFLQPLSSNGLQTSTPFRQSSQNKSLTTKGAYWDVAGATTASADDDDHATKDEGMPKHI